jgi:hypothetical protein
VDSRVPLVASLRADPSATAFLPLEGAPMRPSLSIVAAAIAALGFALASPRPASAASPITGTINCAASGTLQFSAPYLPAELAPANTKPLRTKLVNDSSTCDDSGVVGASIGTVGVTILGKLAAETSCSDFVDTLSYDAKVRLRWKGAHGLGTSKTTVASVTFDGVDAMVLVTDPIERGPFAGSTVTMRLGFANMDFFTGSCLTADYRYSAFLFGSATYGPWTISVP